jgi:hypothetical protein
MRWESSLAALIPFVLRMLCLPVVGILCGMGADVMGWGFVRLLSGESFFCQFLRDLPR